MSPFYGDRMGIDMAKMGERLRSRIYRQEQDIAILGWKERDHNDKTLAWKTSGRIHFHDGMPADGLPKSVSLVLFTVHVDNGVRHAARLQRDFVADKIQPQAIKNMLEALPLPVPVAVGEAAGAHEHSNGVTPSVVPAHEDEGAAQEAAEADAFNDFFGEPPVDAEEPNTPLELKVLELEEGQSVKVLRPSKGREVAKAAFARMFCEAESLDGGVPVTCRIAKDIGNKLDLSQFVYSKWLEGVPSGAMGRITAYRSTPELRQLAGVEEPEDASADDVSAEEEPADLMQKLEWLSINLEYFEGQLAEHQTGVEKFQEYVRRSREASELMEKVRKV